MAIGYSRNLVEANKQANAKHPGVALGRYCIAQDISVYAVSSYFGVSRMTVYNWFKGANIPSPRVTERIKRYIGKLK
jgi:hypothetical protein